MKVKKQFYCILEKKTYKEGEEYKGKRKDIDDYLDKKTKKEK